MDTKGYSKSGKVLLLGFVLFSLIIMWGVNSYFIEERKYIKREMELEAGKAVFSDTNAVNKILDDMHLNLLLQKKTLEEYLSNKELNSEDNIMKNSIYLEKENVSILDEAKLEKKDDIGNVLMYGKWDSASSDLKKEITGIFSFFKMQNIIQRELAEEINTVYYSKNKYVTYFPYIEIGEKTVDYKQIFSNVDSLIKRIQELDKTDPQFDPEEGWDRTSLDSAKNVLLTTAIPVVENDKIQGILTSTYNCKNLQEKTNTVMKNKDMYVIDASEQIVFSENMSSEGINSVAEVFQKKYGIKYYKNKFPLEYEVRNEKNHTLYITQLVKNNWYLVYVVNNNTVYYNGRIIFFNILMIIMLAGIIYYYTRFASLNKDDIENMIKNSKNDSMTDLLNHKHIIEILKKFVKNRRIKQIAVMMLDLDNFKAVNDNFGHAKGDEVIKACADVLKTIFNNEENIAGRYGGEEFMLIARRLSKESAIELADKIRIKINQGILDKTGLDITVSIGVYHLLKPSSQSAAELIELADQNLYLAKSSGKNQVIGSSNE